MKQQLFILPNTNSLYNIIRHLNVEAFNNDNEKAFIIQSDYRTEQPTKKLLFSCNQNKIETFLKEIKHNELLETRVAYEYALHSANLFPWKANLEKEIFFFYHRQPNTPNHFFNEMNIDAFKEIKKLEQKGIKFIPVYIKNPHNKISQWNNYFLNTWQDINELILNVEAYNIEDEENKNFQLIKITRDTKAIDFTKEEQFFFQSKTFLQTSKEPTFVFNNIEFKSLTNRKVKEGDCILYRILH